MLGAGYVPKDPNIGRRRREKLLESYAERQRKKLVARIETGAGSVESVGKGPQMVTRFTRCCTLSMSHGDAVF